MNWNEIFDKNVGVYAEIIRNYLMENCESKCISIENSLQKVSLPSKGKLLTKFYKEKGTYPIIDQGKRFIAGYIDDEFYLVKNAQPIIVFGDHTRILKYIEFDFALGADGVKLIKPMEKFDVKFFYYQMFAFKYEEKGYSRYFKQLSQKEIVIPFFANPLKSMQMQKLIVKFLDGLSKNNLRRTYFDSITEKRILKIQTSSLYIYDLLTNILPQQQTHLQQLRQAILQEAVQGKLSESGLTELKNGQNKKPHRKNSKNYIHSANSDSDNDAAKLLQRIKAEKQKLIATGKLKKEKELPPISKEEIPFELPKGWVWCRLGELINIGSSKRIYASDYTKSGIPFYRSMEIGQLGENKEIKIELFISEDKYNEIKKTYGIPKAGDILIACIGGSIGNTWVVDGRTFYYKDGNLVLLESIPEIRTDYLLNYLKSDLFMESAMERVLGSAYNALTIIKIKNSLFPLPPTSAQQHIVTKVQKLLEMVNQLEHQVAQSQTQAQQLLQAVLKDAFTGKGKVYEMNDDVMMAAEE